MKTFLDDDGSNERARKAIEKVAREFKPVIKEALLACAERVSVVARGSYLRGPKPERLRSRVGAATGYGGSRVAGGGRLEKSLIVHGGGYESLATGAATGDLLLRFVAVGTDNVALDYGTRVPYAAIWEYGPPTRTIVPKRAKALRFVTESGDVVYTKRVTQKPGHREFLAPALKDSSPEFGEIIGKALGKVLDRYGGN